MYSSTGWHFTFDELDRLTDEAAVGLARRGVTPAMSSRWRCRRRPTIVIAYGALAKLGAISAGVNPKLAPPERSTLVNECAHADHVITTDALGGPMRIDANIDRDHDRRSARRAARQRARTRRITCRRCRPIPNASSRSSSRRARPACPRARSSPSRRSTTTPPSTRATAGAKAARSRATRSSAMSGSWQRCRRSSWRAPRIT